jgi:sugar phosphate permease
MSPGTAIEAGKPSRPQRRWLVLAISVFAQGAVAIFITGLPAIGPALQRHYGLSLIQTGAIFSAISVGAVLTVTMWGVAADRWGERVVLGAGLGGGAIVIATLSLTTRYPVVLALVTVAGALTATASVGSGRALMAWFGPRERGLALGLRQMAIPLGGALAAVALPFIVTRASIPDAFVVLAVICAVPALAAVVGLRVQPPGAARARSGGPWHAPLRDRRLWRLALASALIVIGQTSMVAYLVLYLTGVRHLPLQSAALVLLVAQLGGAGSRVGLGYISDRIGSRIRPLRWIGAVSSALFALCAIGLDAPLPTLLPLAIAATIAGMSANGLAYTAAAEIGGAQGAGGALGFQNAAMYLAGACSPLAFGALVSLLDWRSGFVLLSLAAAAGWLILRALVAQENGGWERITIGSASGRAART